MRNGFMGYMILIAVIMAVAIIVKALISRGDVIKAWYPIKSITAKCSNGDFNVYLMSHTTGWASWPYFVSVETSREVVLSEDCVLMHKDRYPIWRGNSKKDTRTPLQKANTFTTVRMERR